MHRRGETTSSSVSWYGSRRFGGLRVNSRGPTVLGRSPLPRARHVPSRLLFDVTHRAPGRPVPGPAGTWTSVFRSPSVRPVSPPSSSQHGVCKQVLTRTGKRRKSPWGSRPLYGPVPRIVSAPDRTSVGRRHGQWFRPASYLYEVIQSVSTPLYRGRWNLRGIHRASRPEGVRVR